MSQATAAAPNSVAGIVSVRAQAEVEAGLADALDIASVPEEEGMAAGDVVIHGYPEPA